MDLKLGIIGAGYWGDKLIRVFRDIPGAHLKMVCDSDVRRTASVASEFETTTSTDTLLQRDDIDAVLVATPPSTHYTLARAVLASGKHCWVEKPLALRAADARELVQQAHAQDRTLFVDETFLYDPLIQQARAWIEHGRLGQIFHLSFERLGMGRIRRDSDVWWNSAPHDLAILRYLVPATVDRIQVDGFAYLQDGIADVAAGTITLAGGISVHMYLSWMSPLKTASIVVVGQKGMLHYEGRFGQRAIRFFEYAISDPAAVTDNVVPISRFEARESVDGGTEEPLRLAAQAFVDSIRSGIPAPSAGEYSQHVVELLEAGAPRVCESIRESN